MKNPKVIVVNGQWCDPSVVGRLTDFPRVCTMRHWSNDSFEDRVSALVELVTQNPNVTVVGYSMGALVALRASNLVSIRHLILIAPAPLPGQWFSLAVNLALLKYFFKIIFGLPFLISRRDAERFFFSKTSPNNYTKLIKDSGKLVRMVALNQFCIWRRRNFIPKPYTELSILSGDSDPVSTPKIVSKVRGAIFWRGDSIDQSSHQFSCGTGHMPFLEASGNFVAEYVMGLVHTNNLPPGLGDP